MVNLLSHYGMAYLGNASAVARTQNLTGFTFRENYTQGIKQRIIYGHDIIYIEFIFRRRTLAAVFQKR
jgi:hypothetical protein